MRKSSIVSLWKKELLNTRRDKRSFWMTILMPGLFFPLMMIVFPIVASLATSTSSLKPELRIAYQGELPEDFKRHIAGTTMRVVKLEPVKDAQKAIGKYAIAMKLPNQMPRSLNDQESTIEIFSDPKKRVAELARIVIDKAVTDFNRGLWEADLAAKGIASKAPKLLKVSQASEASNAFKAPMFSMLGIMLPLMFVLWAMTGSQGAAIEALVHERDHGTFETLLSSSVTRAEVLLGKYLNVVSMATISAISGCIGLLIILVLGRLAIDHFFGSFSGIVTNFLAEYLPKSVDLLSILYGSLAGMSCITLIAAIALFPNVFAPSIKEAQLYIAPAMIAVMALAAPALFAEVFGFGKLVQWIPLSNTVAILSGSFSGEPDWLRLIISIGCNAALTIGLLSIQLFFLSREKTIFKSA